MEGVEGVEGEGWSRPGGHLVDQNVRHVGQRGLVLEHAQQHARRAEEQRRRRALPTLAAHCVAHGAGAGPAAQLLAALSRDALGDPDRRDTPRLRAHHIDQPAVGRRRLEHVLRHLSRLATPRLPLDDAHLRLERGENLRAVASDG